MKRFVVFRPEVREDVDVAYRWYEERRAGLGNEFLAALRDVVERLPPQAESYAVIFRSVRALFVRRFPFVIYYRVREVRIEVVAIVHARRRSQIWRKRIRGEE